MNENSSSSSNFWANFRQILVLPKWVKVFLVALSGVAVAGLIAAFGLKAWAADKVDSGEIVLKGIDRGTQERILKAENAENKFAFDSRLYFARLDFLLRSKVIAHIDIQGISWASGVDKNAVSDISSHNRWVKFATTQDLISQGFNEKNLGKVEYKMDFSPLIATIFVYYFIIAFGLCAFVFILNFFQDEFAQTSRQIRSKRGGGGGSFWQLSSTAFASHSSTPLASHSATPTDEFSSKAHSLDYQAHTNAISKPFNKAPFYLFALVYIFFYALNTIFPTQSDDINAGFGGLNGAIASYTGWNGRFGELMRVAFGGYFAHTPYYAFVNALVCTGLFYLFFVLIFARLPLTSQASRKDDLCFISLIFICLFAFDGFGSVFYWAAGSFNYLWAWALILLWCVPYRLFWGDFFAQSTTNSALNSAQNDKADEKTPALLMLLLGLIAGWCSELNIVLFALQACFIALALAKKVRLPAWFYAGVLGLIAGWAILYFSPGHASRASLEIVKPYYTSLGELLAMPIFEILRRLAGTFYGVKFDIFIAVAGLFVFLWLKLAPQGKAKALLIALFIIAIITYAIKDTRFAFLLIAIFLSLYATFKLRKTDTNSALLCLVLCGLFVADFLMFAATIQIALPSRAKLPYTLLACASIIVSLCLLKPYISRISKALSACLCLVCLCYGLFVLSASVNMRLKWEQMLASIATQKAMGQTEIIVDKNTFSSYYEGYGDWGNPSHKHDEWPNTTYAEVFGAKKFIVRDFKNEKSAK